MQVAGTKLLAQNKLLLPFVRTKGNQKPPAGKKWLNSDVSEQALPAFR
jgi:hypothetical protein